MSHRGLGGIDGGLIDDGYLLCELLLLLLELLLHEELLLLGLIKLVHGLVSLSCIILRV